PVLVDIDPTTLNLDLDCVGAALSPATRAVIPVHLAGMGVDVKALRTIVGSGVRIIEDAAHALPTVSNGSTVGACRDSDAAVFSFYATKTMTTGEGGMITTRDPQIASRCRIMRLHGIDRDAFDRYRSTKPAWFYDITAAGYKYNMPDTAAAIGRVQLRRSDRMHLRRSELAERYIAELGDLSLEMPL
ncbi:MAG: DegT/DnrJ/EryC1/StrS family aminotransferase, partial [Planctomycetales bacterium]|nr:DegT/DnrJ/EryC1/StrS family aminotransferase [Planctomycetales bacterium]